MTKSIYVRTDERIEAVRALEFLEYALRLTIGDQYYWKWAIIALHNAMQAFITCAISGTAGLGAIKERIAAQWLKVYDAGGGPYPDLRLDWFPELYARMKKQLNFAPHQSVDDSVNSISTFRNEFIHFTPRSWSLEANGLPQMAEKCLEVVKFLGWEPGHITWYEGGMLQKAKNYTTGALDLLKKLEHEYNG